MCAGSTLYSWHSLFVAPQKCICTLHRRMTMTAIISLLALVLKQGIVTCSFPSKHTDLFGCCGPSWVVSCCFNPSPKFLLATGDVSEEERWMPPLRELPGGKQTHRQLNNLLCTDSIVMTNFYPVISDDYYRMNLNSVIKQLSGIIGTSQTTNRHFKRALIADIPALDQTVSVNIMCPALFVHYFMSPCVCLKYYRPPGFCRSTHTHTHTHTHTVAPTLVQNTKKHHVKTRLQINQRTKTAWTDNQSRNMCVNVCVLQPCWRCNPSLHGLFIQPSRALYKQKVSRTTSSQSAVTSKCRACVTVCVCVCVCVVSFHVVHVIVLSKDPTPAAVDLPGRRDRTQTRCGQKYVDRAAEWGKWNSELKPQTSGFLASHDQLLPSAGTYVIHLKAITS